MLTTNTYVEVNADGLVVHQVTLTRQDSDTTPIPKAWVLVTGADADKDLAGMRYANGTFGSPVKAPPVSSPSDQVLAAMLTVEASVTTLRNGQQALAADLALIKTALGVK